MYNILCLLAGVKLGVCDIRVTATSFMSDMGATETINNYLFIINTFAYELHLLEIKINGKLHLKNA